MADRIPEPDEHDKGMDLAGIYELLGGMTPGRANVVNDTVAAIVRRCHAAEARVAALERELQEERDARESENKYP